MRLILVVFYQIGIEKIGVASITVIRLRKKVRTTNNSFEVINYRTGMNEMVSSKNNILWAKANNKRAEKVRKKGQENLGIVLNVDWHLCCDFWSNAQWNAKNRLVIVRVLIRRNAYRAPINAGTEHRQALENMQMIRTADERCARCHSDRNRRLRWSLLPSVCRLSNSHDPDRLSADQSVGQPDSDWFVIGEPKRTVDRPEVD